MNTKQKRNVKITSAEQADAKISMDIFDTLYPTKFRLKQRLYLWNIIPTHQSKTYHMHYMIKSTVN